MTQLSLRISVVNQVFDDDESVVLGEALCFPEFSCCEEDSAGARNLVIENVLHWLTDLPTGELHRRVVPGEATAFDVKLLLEPVARTKMWREPIELMFPAVNWRQAADAHVAYVPALGIEAVVNDEDELPRRVEQEIRSALMRTKATKSLRSLVELQRCRRIEVSTSEIQHLVHSPKQQAIDDGKPDEDDGKVLRKVAELLSAAKLPAAFERDELVRQVANILTGRVPRSVLLVGASGVGKSAIVYELARRPGEFGMRHPIWATSGSRLVSGMTGFGMWQERCQKLAREVSEANALLHIGPLLELMEVGKSEHQSQGIASFLRPLLARGELLVIAECTPEQLSLIERQDTALLRAFQQVRVDEPNREVGRSILRRVAQSTWQTTAELFDPLALEELDRLHRRFATYSAYPGRPLRFLKNLRQDVTRRRPENSDEVNSPTWVARSESSKGVVDGRVADNHALGKASGRATQASVSATISPRDVVHAFSRETGLPLWLLDDEVPLDLEATREQFAERVIGQPEAVSQVVDLLATMKAGLNREHKPLASFLFLGPTGVGKTELAKALADFVFGAGTNSERQRDSRLIRIDMSEFSDPWAVQRLIGGTWESEGVLTARVREQPFAVVLLDEFEKAHPALFDLLLQVLGEGRLTDAAGRLADFRNCVIIMTSNLGAATFQKGAVGFASGPLDQQRSREHFLKSVRDFVRPEFFNRIDRIVPFSPLDEATARRIVVRQLELIRQRDGLKFRRVTFDAGEDVVEHLLARGFEPRYGARSLKRVIERDLLAPLAEQFNGYSADMVLRAEAVVDGGVLKTTVRAVSDPSGRLLTSVGTEAAQLELVSQLQDLRASIQRLQRSPSILNLQNEVFRMAAFERRLSKQKKLAESDMRQLHRLAARRDLLTRLDAECASMSSQEDVALLALYSERGAAALDDRLKSIVTDAGIRLREVLFDLFDLDQEEPDRLRMSLFADDNEVLRRLAEAYRTVAAGMQANFTIWHLLPSTVKREEVREEDWSLANWKWEQIAPPANEPRRETWQFVPKQSPGEARPAPLLLRQRIGDTEEFLKHAPDGALGLLVELSGPRVFARFVGETGLHKFEFNQSKPQCVVETSLPKFAEYLPPFGCERRPPLTTSGKRREYDYVKGLIIDPTAGKPLPLGPHNLAANIAQLTELQHIRAAESLIQ